jgi:hypothetical protein
MFNYNNLLVPYLGLTILQIWHAILQIWHVRTGLICHAVSTASLVSSLSPFVPPLQGTFIPPPSLMADGGRALNLLVLNLGLHWTVQ